MRKLLLLLPLLLCGCNVTAQPPYACIKIYYVNSYDFFYVKSASGKDGMLLLVDLYDRPILVKGYTGYSIEKRGGDKSSVSSH